MDPNDRSCEEHHGWNQIENWCLNHTHTIHCGTGLHFHPSAYIAINTLKFTCCTRPDQTRPGTIFQIRKTRQFGTLNSSILSATKIHLNKGKIIHMLYALHIYNVFGCVIYCAVLGLVLMKYHQEFLHSHWQITPSTMMERS